MFICNELLKSIICLILCLLNSGLLQCLYSEIHIQVYSERCPEVNYPTMQYFFLFGKEVVCFRSSLKVVSCLYRGCGNYWSELNQDGRIICTFSVFLEFFDFWDNFFYFKCKSKCKSKPSVNQTCALETVKIQHECEHFNIMCYFSFRTFRIHLMLDFKFWIFTWRMFP